MKVMINEYDKLFLAVVVSVAKQEICNAMEFTLSRSLSSIFSVA